MPAEEPREDELIVEISNSAEIVVDQQEEEEVVVALGGDDANYERVEVYGNSSSDGSSDAMIRNAFYLAKKVSFRSYLKFIQKLLCSLFFFLPTFF